MIMLDNCLNILYHNKSKKSVAFATKEKILCYQNKTFYLKESILLTANV